MRKKRESAYIVSGVRMIEQRRKNKTIAASDLKEKIAETGWGEENGVYVYGQSGGNWIKPMYVGSTERRSMREEATTYHKMATYKDGLLQSRGKAVLFLLPYGRRRPASSSKKAIASQEDIIMKLAHAVNPRLLNKRLPPKSLDGAEPKLQFRRGRPNKPETLFRKMLKIQ